MRGHRRNVSYASSGVDIDVNVAAILDDVVVLVLSGIDVIARNWKRFARSIIVLIRSQGSCPGVVEDQLKFRSLSDHTVSW